MSFFRYLYCVAGQPYLPRDPYSETKGYACPRKGAKPPGMAARKNGVVYDFLQDTFKKTPQACFILDIPDLAQADPAAAFFLKEMNSGNYKGIRYAFDNLNGIPRVILTGDADAVLRMASAYHAQASSQENEHLPAF